MNPATVATGLLVDAVRDSRLERVVWLLGLDPRPDPNALWAGDGAPEIYPFGHCNALHAAAYEGCIEAVKALVAAGADVNRTTFSATAVDSGASPLILAASHPDHTDFRVIRFLVDWGADPDATTSMGHTAAMMAAMYVEDAQALPTIKLLASMGANLVYRNERGRDLFGIAGPQTLAWLEETANFSPVQFCISLDEPGELEALLARKECDPFARAPGTPSLEELAAGNAPLLQLCAEVRSKWRPALHHLFHHAHRSAVASLMLVSRRDANRHALGWRWLSGIPTEIWLLIAENLGRMGWSHEDRVAVWPF